MNTSVAVLHGGIKSLKSHRQVVINWFGVGAEIAHVAEPFEVPFCDDI